MTRQRVLIAGAGLGGLRAAEQLRANGFEDEIVVVGAERHPPYNRPPLSKSFSDEALSIGALAFRHKASVADVDWRLGCAVARARPDERVVGLEDGTVLPYDALIVATGVRARRLPFAGDASRPHVIRTLDDAQAIKARLVPAARITVIGAGFIGCEVAAAARSGGCEVDVVDPLPTPLAAVLGPGVGAELRRRHESHGVRFHLGRTVAAIDETPDGPKRLTLDDGVELVADVVLEAVGTVSNLEWLEGCDLDLTDGVRCDNLLRPVVADEPLERVAAVGDIARFPNPRFDDVPRRIEHWNMPGETAKRAARVLVGQLRGAASDELGQLPEFAPMPSFWSDQYGFRLQSFGLPVLGRADARLLEGRLDDEFAMGYHSDGRLVGVVCVGLARRHPALRTMVEDRRPQTAAS